MGCIYRRPDSRNLWIKYYRDGKAFHESTGSTAPSKAKKLLRVREGDIERGEVVNPKIGRIRFEGAMDLIKRDYRLRNLRSLSHVERRITKHLAPVFAGRLMTSIDYTAIQTYMDDRMQAGAATGSIVREVAILKRAFRLAVKAKELLPSHVPDITLPSEAGNARKGFFSREQCEAVRDRLAEPLRPLITFTYITGWRVPSEVLPLQWRQVDFKTGEVRLDAGTTKNGEGRVFPFTTELKKLLEAQRTEADKLKARGVVCPWVFHRDGERIKNFYTAWRTVCKNAGCPGRVPHDFRRTAVRNLVRAGVADSVAMKMVGHKTRSVFDRYNITSDSDLVEAARKLDAFGGATTTDTEQDKAS